MQMPGCMCRLVLLLSGMRACISGSQINVSRWFLDKADGRKFHEHDTQKHVTSSLSA